MKLAVQAIGKNAVKELNRGDLVTVDKELAEFMRIRYAGTRRRKHQDEYAQPGMSYQQPQQEVQLQ